jgi:PhnB protein
MARLSPYLHFDGNCREAMDFYRDCLGGELWVQTVGETPMAQGMPVETHDRILHAELTAGDVKIMASDMSAPEQLVRSGSVTLCYNGADLAATRAIFDKLSAGANVTNPLKEEFFGTYGDLTDKYGISWMFQVGGEQGA